MQTPTPPLNFGSRRGKLNLSSSDTPLIQNRSRTFDEKEKGIPQRASIDDADWESLTLGSLINPITTITSISQQVLHIHSLSEEPIVNDNTDLTVKYLLPVDELKKLRAKLEREEEVSNRLIAQLININDDCDDIIMKKRKFNSARASVRQQAPKKDQKYTNFWNSISTTDFWRMPNHNDFNWLQKQHSFPNELMPAKFHLTPEKERELDSVVERMEQLLSDLSELKQEAYSEVQSMMPGYQRFIEFTKMDEAFLQHCVDVHNLEQKRDKQESQKKKKKKNMHLVEQNTKKLELKQLGLAQVYQQQQSMKHMYRKEASQTNTVPLYVKEYEEFKKARRNIYGEKWRLFNFMDELPFEVVKAHQDDVARRTKGKGKGKGKRRAKAKAKR
ncbi:hypothetical protein PCE1_000400 [Barthelona sp. PCE]